MRYTEGNRIGVVKTETDKSMNDKWCIVIVKTLFDVSDPAFKWYLARLGD